MSDLKTIAEFLAQKRIAIVGLSHDPADFSHTVASELEARGAEIVGVHPGIESAGGRSFFERLQDVNPPVGGALLMVPPDAALAVVMDCIEAHIPRVWFHRGMGPGALSEEAVGLAKSSGLKVVDGECPLMFVSDTGFGHRAHGWVRKATGHYPDEGPRGAVKPGRLHRA